MVNEVSMHVTHECVTMLYRLPARISSCCAVGRYQMLSSHVNTTQEPPVFDFEAIDHLVRRKEPTAAKSLAIDKDDRALFYWLLRNANAVVYAATNLGGSSGLIKASDGEALDTRRGELEWLCDRIADRLQYYSLDNRIIILQRALAAYHHSRLHCWNRLVKTALRSCFINDERLCAAHLVKICAALSKWRHSRLTEILPKLDLSILAESNWNLDQASHILWSLGHLRLYNMRAFDYMNNVVDKAISTGVHPTHISDDAIHRILNANLIKLSHIGTHHHVVKAILVMLQSHPYHLNYLSSKTLVAIASLLPLYPDSGITPHLIARISQSIHKFTHAQIAHVMYNLAVIRHYLPSSVVDSIISVLFEVKESIYKADAVYVPSLVAKLLFTFREFLGGFDQNIMHKCLSDLNSNLHLIVPFSLVGNLQCVDVYAKDKEAIHSERELDSIRNTRNNLLKLDERGYFLKRSSEGHYAPLDKLKLWHMGMLTRLTSHGKRQLMDALIGFIDQVTPDNIQSSLKDFVLFLYNVSSNTALYGDRNFLNSVVITASRLWNDYTTGRESEYWDHIKVNLSAMGLKEVFQRECQGELPTSLVSTTAPLLAALQDCILFDSVNCKEDIIMESLRRASLTPHGDRSNADWYMIKYILFICILYDNKVAKVIPELSRPKVKQILTEAFYNTSREHALEYCDVDMGSKFLHYINEAIWRFVSPVDASMAYTRSFFLQDHPSLLLKELPYITMAELCPQKVYDVNIWSVARCLESVGISSLKEHLVSIKEKEPDEVTQWQEVARNIHRPISSIRGIKKNVHIGPYLCHFSLFGDDIKSHIHVFLRESYSNADYYHGANNVFNLQHRKVLQKLDIQFIELTSITADNIQS